VVLGIFGAGRKAAMVVPNKVYQAAAVGRPLVTRDGPALREVLTPASSAWRSRRATRRARRRDRRALADPPAAQRMGAAARASSRVTSHRGASPVARATLDATLGIRLAAPSQARAGG
jgi:hypothetical protein